MISKWIVIIGVVILVIFICCPGKKEIFFTLLTMGLIYLFLGGCMKPRPRNSLDIKYEDRMGYASALVKWAEENKESLDRDKEVQEWQR